MDIIQIVFILLFPWVIVKLTKTFNKLSFISPIIVCYIVGIVIANLEIIPFSTRISMDLSTFSVPLAIPLILFSTDFMAWKKLARKTILSFLLVLLSAFIAAFSASFIFRAAVPEHYQLSGMLVGVYTGGTPNMMAIGAGLNVDESMLGALNVADTICGAIYFLFIISIGKWLLQKFLPPFKKEALSLGKQWHDSMQSLREPHPYGKIERIKNVFAAAALDLLIVGISVGTALIITGGNFGKIEIPAILLITTFAVAASFIPKVRAIKGSYEAGEYLLLVFSLAIGTAANFKHLINFAPMVFSYTALVMFGAIFIHICLSAIFRIDVDTTIITSVAGIYGPAFVGPIASVIKNKEVILSGMLCGLIGYAVGNYLGFFVSWLLM